MEQFAIYHNRRTKPRNRLEAHLIEWIKSFLSEPVGLTIEQVKEAVEDERKRYSDIHKNHGSVGLGIICKFSSYCYTPHIQKRGFILFGRGRQTHTLHIKETVDKNADNNFLPAVKPW